MAESGPSNAPSALQLIAEVDLTGLSAEEATARLLDVVRDVLHVDTAVVLLTDPTGTHLQASAASGLDDEVRQGFRMPVGGGFAGRIAATRAAAVLEDVDAAAALNPLLIRRGLRSMSGVPLVVGRTLLGVLHVGSLHTRTFDSDDVAVLQLVGERIAHILYAEQTSTDRATALMLQRSLLPGRLPDVADLEFASRFVPARGSRVGGDWFDAFELPDGRVGVVMGDVVGSGMRAAVIMGRLRSALRSYALEFPDPADVLDRLNRKVMHFEPGQMATVLYLTISTDRSTLAISSAGHPPPIGARPGREAEYLACRPSPPLGFGADIGHVTTTHELEVGMTIAAFTDGLFERRTAPIDEQLELLRRSVAAGRPDDVAGDVMRALVGTHVVEDDTALLVLRRTS
jgi:hypothetical protein